MSIMEQPYIIATVDGRTIRCTHIDAEAQVASPRIPDPDKIMDGKARVTVVTIEQAELTGILEAGMIDYSDRPYMRMEFTDERTGQDVVTEVYYPRTPSDTPGIA